MTSKVLELLLEQQKINADLEKRVEDLAKRVSDFEKSEELELYYSNLTDEVRELKKWLRFLRDNKKMRKLLKGEWGW